MMGILIKGGTNASVLGKTALHHAAEKGHVAVVRRLLRDGADKSGNDEKGRTPLSHAAENGHAFVIEILLDAGADPGLDEGAKPVLLHASGARDPGCFRALLKHPSVDYCVTSRDANISGLHIAVSKNHYDTTITPRS